MKWYVFYEDNHGTENTGFEMFETEDEASAFIEGRIPGATHDWAPQYRVIHGFEKKVMAVEVTTRIRFE